MDRDRASATAEDDDAKTVLVSQESDLLKNAHRSQGPPRPSTMPPSRGSNTRLKSAPVVPVPYTDLVEDDHTTVLEPERLDDLKTSMGRKSPLLPPKRPPKATLGSSPPPQPLLDPEKTTIFHPEPPESPPRHDETTRRPFLSKPAPQIIEPDATLPAIGGEQSVAPTPPVQPTTVFTLGMVVGFLIAIAVGLSLVLYLVSTGRMILQSDPSIPTQEGNRVSASVQESYL